MRPSTNKRNKNRTVHSRAFGVLVVLWVSLGIQPCAVAAVEDSGCPHCPPEHEQPMATHDGHSDGMNESASCASMQPMVCEVDEVAVDSRIGKIDDVDAAVVVAVPGTAEIYPVASDTFVAIAPDPPERRRSAVPLHILYCVYRD